MGFIGSIGLAWSNGIVVRNSIYSIKEERSAFLTFVWFVVGMVVTAAGSIILFALGEILEPLKGDGSWRCVNCGRVNAGHTGTCGCGQSRNA